MKLITKVLIILLFSFNISTADMFFKYDHAINTTNYIVEKQGGGELPMYGNIYGPIEVNDDTIIIMLKGKFDTLTEINLRGIYMLHNDKNIMFIANSIGGETSYIGDVMDMVYNHKKTYFFVPEHAVCYSLCGLLAISAKEKMGVIMLHTSRDVYTNAISRSGNKQIFDRLVRAGFNKKIARQILISGENYTFVYENKYKELK